MVRACKSWFVLLVVVTGVCGMAAAQTSSVYLGGTTYDVTTLEGAPYRYEDVANHREETFFQGQRWNGKCHGFPYSSSFKAAFPNASGRYDMGGRSTVAVTFYQQAGTFIGTLTATGMKPNFAYQVKLLGKPTRRFDSSGDDGTNEAIGYKGRWWKSHWNGTKWVSDGNATDTDYNNGKNDPSLCFEGYLMFDFFVTDYQGNANLSLRLNSSYHVLWKVGQPNAPSIAAGAKSVNYTVRARVSDNYAYDADWSSQYPSEANVTVFAEPEPGRPAPGSVTLSDGSYHCRLLLTEETFHSNWYDWNWSETADLDGGFWQGAAIQNIDFTIGNTPPTVTISSPANGSIFESGTSIQFQGTASDIEDGDLTSNLVWASNLDGQIGTGGSFSTAALVSVGTHVITAQSTDSKGMTGGASANITVTPSSRPTVTITSPENGSAFESGTLVSFEGSANDPNDGNLTSSLSWTSSLDGTIGTGGSFSTDVLSIGTHVITAQVTDSDGNPGSASITITVSSPNSPPTVTITSPLNGAQFDAGSSAQFQGSASDYEDGNLTSSLTWTSSLDGTIGTGGSFSKVLSAGTHVITAQVTDSGGETGSAAVTVTVVKPVITVTKAEYRRSNKQLVVEATYKKAVSGTPIVGATLWVFNANAVQYSPAMSYKSTTKLYAFTKTNAADPLGSVTVRDLIAGLISAPRTVTYK